MRRLLSGLAILALALARTSATSAVAGPFPAFAVVELFTSEGCSSCPPAERLVSEVVAQAEARHLPVYCLAFHVDYFDDLGWKDPFSSAESTRHQYAYQRVSRTGDVYTPQIIIDGTNELVAGDRARLGTEVDAALASPAGAGLELQVVTAAPREGATSNPARVTVSYAVTGAPSRAALNLALVERTVTSRVVAGENAGRTLVHDNVVRAFVTVPLRGRPAGTATVVIPAGVAAGHVSIIGFVQDPSTMAVLAAASAAPTLAH